MRALSIAAFALVVVVAGICVSACSSPSSSSGAALHRQCTNIADVLSDGPDPGADPAGYAEAQVLPLRELKFSDATLRRAVDELASAYATYSTAAGAAGRASDLPRVSSSERQLDKLCPHGIDAQLLPGQAKP